MNSISMVLSGRGGLAPLFSEYKEMRAVIEAILQGNCGTVEADIGAHVASLSLGQIRILGGDVSHPSARELVESLQAGNLVITNNAWRDLVTEIHGDSIFPVRRTYFSPKGLDLDHLFNLAINVPMGYTIKRIDFDLAECIREDIGADLISTDAFASPDDFVRRGVGFCAVDGRRIICAAVTDVVSDGTSQISIGRGTEQCPEELSAAVASTLAIHCLRNGMAPHWDAENQHSVDLATNLGYTDHCEYQALALISDCISSEISESEFVEEDTRLYRG